MEVPVERGGPDEGRKNSVRVPSREKGSLSHLLHSGGEVWASSSRTTPTGQPQRIAPSAPRKCHRNRSGTPPWRWDQKPRRAPRHGVFKPWSPSALLSPPRGSPPLPRVVFASNATRLRHPRRYKHSGSRHLHFHARIESRISGMASLAYVRMYRCLLPLAT